MSYVSFLSVLDITYLYPLEVASLDVPGVGNGCKNIIKKIYPLPNVNSKLQLVMFNKVLSFKKYIES
jgi:hypothetical protein